MLAYEGEVMLVQTEGEMARALSFLKRETLLGFDTESRPSFKKGKSYPTSLIQLAGSELVVLIRLNLIPFSGPLAALLADPGVIKAGVAIRDDMRALQKLHDFTPGGLVDLAEMAKRCGIKAQGLWRRSSWAAASARPRSAPTGRRRRSRRSKSAMPPRMRG